MKFFFFCKLAHNEQKSFNILFISRKKNVYSFNYYTKVMFTISLTFLPSQLGNVGSGFG